MIPVAEVGLLTGTMRMRDAMHSWKGPEKWCRGERVEGERGSKGPESEAANIYRSRSRRTDKVLYCLKVARPVAKTQEVVVSKSCIHPVVRRRKGNPCTGVGTHCFLSGGRLLLQSHMPFVHTPAAIVQLAEERIESSYSGMLQAVREVRHRLSELVVGSPLFTQCLIGSLLCLFQLLPQSRHVVSTLIRCQI